MPRNRNVPTNWRRPMPVPYRSAMTINEVRSTGWLFLCVLALASRPSRLDSQPLSSSVRMASRAELQRLLTTYEQFAASSAYGERTKQKARLEADEIRRRLTEGDFRVGDRLLLRVDGSVSIDDTVTVMEGGTFTARGIRDISVTGVLREELSSKVTAEVVQVVRNATVGVRPLMRVAVFGAVARPGYVSVPAETRLDQLLSVAGGATAEAGPGNFRIVRGDTVLMQGGAIIAAIAEGRTLGAMEVREGDVLQVERRSPALDRASTLQIATMFLAPLVLVLVR